MNEALDLRDDVIELIELKTSNAEQRWVDSLKVCWSNNQTTFRVDGISVNWLEVTMGITLLPDVECPQHP